MKRMAIALAALSGVASAQGTPFSYTESWVAAPRLQAVLDANAGYGSAYGVGQFAELDLPVGSRLVFIGTGGVAYERSGVFGSVAQAEAMVDAVRFAGWHLAVSGAARRDYDGRDYGLGRLSLSRTAETWAVAANLVATRAFEGASSLPNWSQTYASVGATAKVTSFFSLGGETMAAWSRASSWYVGPVASFALPGGRNRLDLSGGPNVCVTGDCALLPNYTLVERFAAPLPAHQSGYTLRLAVKVGL